MARLKILTGEDNKVLRGKSALVESFDEELKQLVADIKETMIAKKGLGLAAPQVGVSKRVFVLVLDFKGEDERVVAMVNPRILSRGGGTEVAEEGCLSLPGIYEKVERFCDVVVEFFDTGGEKQVLELSGLDAREVQHEYDHLEGILFIDRITKKTGLLSEARPL